LNATRIAETPEGDRRVLAHPPILIVQSGNMFSDRIGHGRFQVEKTGMNILGTQVSLPTRENPKVDVTTRFFGGSMRKGKRSHVQ
jgi:hypothetical protein